MIASDVKCTGRLIAADELDVDELVAAVVVPRLGVGLGAGAHGVTLAAPSRARQTRCGVSGMSRCVTPRAASASIAAFTTAGDEPIDPDSPIPLAPSGLVGDRVTVWSSSNDGRSLAAGTA